MSTLVVISAVLASISTIVLAMGLYKVRHAAINEGLGEDVIDPANDRRYIVNGSVATRWLVVTSIVAIAAFATLLGAWSSLNGALDNRWNMLSIAIGQLFGWGMALSLRNDNIRARAEHQRYLKLYGDQAVT
jgi:hypothetical protein